MLIGINRSYKVDGAGIRITGIADTQPLAMTSRPGISRSPPSPGFPQVAAGRRPGARSSRTASAPAASRCAIGDILVVAQKIVSKAEGRYVDLRDVAPVARGARAGAVTGKDARLVEVILRESAR